MQGTKRHFKSGQQWYSFLTPVKRGSRIVFIGSLWPSPSRSKPVEPILSQDLLDFCSFQLKLLLPHWTRVRTSQFNSSLSWARPKLQFPSSQSFPSLSFPKWLDQSYLWAQNYWARLLSLYLKFMLAKVWIYLVRAFNIGSDLRAQAKAHSTSCLHWTSDQEDF